MLKVTIKTILVTRSLTKIMAKRKRTNGTVARRTRRRTMAPTRTTGFKPGFAVPEVKFKDFRVNDDTFTSVWAGGEMEDATALSVSAVSQGDGESERDGRVYWIHSVFIHGTIDQPAVESATAPLLDQVARIALVWDKQTNGAQLNAEDVFLTIAASDDIDSFRNLQFTKRFQVLKDQRYLIPVARSSMNEGSVNLFASGAITVPFKMAHIFKKPIKVTCKGTAAAIASIVDNSLHIIGTGTTTGTTLSYASRIRFSG